jgi:hypothetical protein
MMMMCLKSLCVVTVLRAFINGALSLLATGCQLALLAKYSLIITLAVSGKESSIRFLRSFSNARSISSEMERVNRFIMLKSSIDVYRRKRY